MLAEKNDKKYMDSAIAVIRTIDADQIRQNHLMKVGYPETYEIPPQYVKIKALSDKMIAEGFHQNQVTALEALS